MVKRLVLLLLGLVLVACSSTQTPTPAPTSTPMPTNTPRPLATQTAAPTSTPLTETIFVEPIRKQIFRQLVDAQHSGIRDEEAYAEIAKQWGIAVPAVKAIAAEGIGKGWLTPAPTTATPIPIPPTPTPKPKPPTVTPIPPTPKPVPPTATPPQGTPPPKVEAPMIVIPAGGFKMGSENGVERPLHVVLVEAFQIDKFEVTNEQFERFVWETGYVTDAERAGDTSWRYYAERKKGCKGEGQYPVVQVSWNDANAFCEWAGKRLPTEAEWEKAAHGVGSLTYPWGNQWEDKGGNKCGGGETGTISCCGHTCPGGSFPSEASPYCVMDMAGNVAEWTSDWFQPYPGYPGGDPEAQYFGEKYRVLRGGGWFSSKEQMRTTARSASSVEMANDDVGFRCAR